MKARAEALYAGLKRRFDFSFLRRRTRLKELRATGWLILQILLAVCLVWLLYPPFTTVFQGWVRDRLVDLPQLVTIALTIIAVEVPINIILHRVLHEGKLDKPDMIIAGTSKDFPDRSLTVQSEDGDYLMLFVKNKGTTGAEQCQAELTIEVYEDDFLSSFQQISARPLRWPNKNYEIPIRVGKPSLIAVARVVRSGDEAYSRIEIPNELGWDSPSTILKPHRSYDAYLTIHIMNGEPTTQYFVLALHNSNKSASLELG